jgi:uncharacterized protein (DUF1697 family)
VPRYALLIRGINVGGNKKVAMADLRELLTGLGHNEVRTLLQSGNAVFTAAGGSPTDLAGQIEVCISERLGLSVRCLVRSPAELRAVVAGNPFLDVMTSGSRMMALFMSARPDPGLLAAHDPAALDPDRAAIGDGVIYQWCPDGVLAAPAVGTFVEKNLKVAVTARNWNTVTKLVALLEE